MNYQTEESRADDPSAAAEWKGVRFSAILVAQTLKLFVEYVRQWMKVVRSDPS